MALFSIFFSPLFSANAFNLDESNILLSMNIDCFTGPLPKDTPIRRPKTPPVVIKEEEPSHAPPPYSPPLSPVQEELDAEPG